MDERWGKKGGRCMRGRGTGGKMADRRGKREEDERKVGEEGRKVDERWRKKVGR